MFTLNHNFYCDKQLITKAIGFGWAGNIFFFLSKQLRGVTFVLF